MMGAGTFPERFRALVAFGMSVTPLTTGRATGSARFIGPSASANVVGRAKASASAIVVSFTVYPVDSWAAPTTQIKDSRAAAIKFPVSAIEAAKLLTSRRGLLLQQSRHSAKLNGAG